MRSCCFCLSLREGSMTIGIIETVLSTFFVALLSCLLSSWSKFEEQLIAHMENTDENFRDVLDGIYIYTLATLGIEVFYLILCLMLIYGAMFRNRCCMIPWTIAVLSTLTILAVVGVLCFVGLVFGIVKANIQMSTYFTSFMLSIAVFLVYYGYCVSCVWSYMRQIRQSALLPRYNANYYVSQYKPPQMYDYVNETKYNLPPC